MGVLSVCDSRWKALLQHTTVCTAHGLRSTAGHCVSRAADWRAWGKSLEIKMAVVISPVSLCCLFLCYAVSPESSSVERAAVCPQKLSTKLPGKRPVLPFLCKVPLYQPSSRFLCTNTMSPSFSSISASLCGGYGTTTRYLRREKRAKTWLICTWWEQLSTSTRDLGKKTFGNISKLHFHTLVVCNAATIFSTKTE